MRPQKLPWRVQPAARSGYDVINAEGEQVALFEIEADAVATVDRMNREWLTGQPWFQQAVREALHGEGTSVRKEVRTPATEEQ